jgi:hypothetical protein
MSNLTFDDAANIAYAGFFGIHPDRIVNQEDRCHGSEVPEEREDEQKEGGAEV